MKNWLQFWSHFKKIHEDKKITDEDKFQYLMQDMVSETRAAELVNDFSPTKENYKQVLDTL